MSESMLRMENVTMQFGGVVAVNNLSLNVDKGEIVALIGPNGAGKTTAFNCITGVYQPTNGKVFFEDNLMVSAHPTGKMQKEYQGMNAEMYLNDKILDPTPDQITKLGIARTFQNIRLWKSMTVFENVLTAKHLRAKQNIFSAALRISVAEDRRMEKETMELLEEQNLAQYRNDLATSLPYGLQRRLEIARALATDPKLLLLDEPAAGMNPSETAELMENIRKMRDNFNIAVMLIEHDMNLVMGICEGICVLNFGQIIAKGTAEEIQANPKVIEAYLGSQKKEGSKG